MSDRRRKGNLPRGPQIYVLCRKCGESVGEITLLTDGTHVLPALRACHDHGPCATPTGREIASAAARARRKSGRVPIRVWPTR